MDAIGGGGWSTGAATAPRVITIASFTFPGETWTGVLPEPATFRLPLAHLD